MSRPWTRKVTAAAKELGKDWGYNVLSPSKIVYETSKGSPVTYQPDCIWTWGRSTPHMVIWEMEHHYPETSYPTWKGIAGDIALASLASTSKAHVYVDSHPLGHALRVERAYVDSRDRRRLKAQAHPGDKVRLDPPASISMLLVVPPDDGVITPRFRDYMDILTIRGPCRFRFSEVVPCNGRSVVAAKRSLSRSEAVREIHRMSGKL